MNFQQYEALLKTVELGSFTKAAAALGYTQSGISHMLAALEKECGCTLLYRDRGGVRRGRGTRGCSHIPFPKRPAGG